MGGLHGHELELRRRSIEVLFFHNEALEPRRATLAFGMPYEFLLGVLCNSSAKTASAATFFLESLQIEPEATSRYLAGFVVALNRQCDFSSCELHVRPEFKDMPMDFPRPLPARVLVWDFAARLAANSLLYSRLRSRDGAESFFHTVLCTIIRCLAARCSFRKSSSLVFAVVKTLVFRLWRINLPFTLIRA
jgi:hypothetical protein